MYFEGEALNDEDRILQRLSAGQRARVVIPFSPQQSGALGGRFEIVLGQRSSAGVTPALD
jgi:hypothetical protein